MKLGNISIYIVFLLAVAGISSCQDVLDTAGTRDLFNKELNQKTDSMFMAFGIMQSMQQLADQYVLTGEMRGDLVDTTYYTDENLRKLADFSVTAGNKYDSAYVYYAVINNCNYYINHRDTTLYTGSTNVTTNEYIAVKAFRAWAYLMLSRLYGNVPFFTMPLTRISDINSGNYPVLSMRQIVDYLAADLENDLRNYGGYVAVPDFGTIACGSTNLGSAKTAQSRLCFIPANVILGDMYLETQQYDLAARHYVNYIVNNQLTTGAKQAPFTASWSNELVPLDFYQAGNSSQNTWGSFFINNTEDIITYIPMAVNRMRGTVTRLPQMFGHNYYATTGSEVDLDEVQITPSKIYMDMADSATYYYQTDQLGTTVKSVNMGDMRRSQSLSGARLSMAEAGLVKIRKYNQGNIILYRGTTVYLHLAEAFNRLGHSDLAFAILKDGVDRYLLQSSYISEESKQLLQTAYPLLSAENISMFDPAAGSLQAKIAYGIHRHGCGVTNGNITPYQYDVIIGRQLKSINGGTMLFSKQDTINAMEDLLCDEYAMELAFEGTRFIDLCRLARHKNSETAGKGSKWLAEKMAHRNISVSLLDEKNWYLPFK